MLESLRVDPILEILVMSVVIITGVFTQPTLNSGGRRRSHD